MLRGIANRILGGSPLTGTTITASTRFVGPAKGASSNGNAVAGNVGEYLSSTIAAAAGVNLSTNAAADMTTITLTAGDWDVSGVAIFNGGATTIPTTLFGGYSTTSATQPTAPDYSTVFFTNAVPFAVNVVAMALPTTRFSVASSTPIYLVATAQFSVSTCKVYGTLSARRVQPGT